MAASDWQTSFVVQALLTYPNGDFAGAWQSYLLERKVDSRTIRWHSGPRIKELIIGLEYVAAVDGGHRRNTDILLREAMRLGTVPPVADPSTSPTYRQMHGGPTSNTIADEGYCQHPSSYHDIVPPTTNRYDSVGHILQRESVTTRTTGSPHRYTRSSASPSLCPPTSTAYRHAPRWKTPSVEEPLYQVAAWCQREDDRFAISQRQEADNTIDQVLDSATPASPVQLPAELARQDTFAPSWSTRQLRNSSQQLLLQPRANEYLDHEWRAAILERLSGDRE